VWAFVVYLHYLHLVYTKLDRHPQEISRYVDAVFSKEALVQTVRDFVSRLGEEHANETPAISLLMEESGMDIERRVSNLLGFLEGTGCISFNKQDQAYSQTLLGAADVAEHYDWEISYLLPQKDIDVDALSHIVIQDDTEKDFSNEPHQ